MKSKKENLTGQKHFSISEGYHTISEEIKHLPEEMRHSKFLRFLSSIVSYVLHPVFLPTVMAIAICWLNLEKFAGITEATKWKWIGITGYLTIFFPLVTLLLIWKLKFIESIFLKTQKDRIIPLIANMVYYFWVYQVFKRQFHAPLMLNVMFLGSFWGIILLFLGNIFFKISMHTTAAGGMIGLMMILMFTGQINFLIPFLITLLIAGMIGTARMILNAHSPLEIWAGYFAGLISMLGAYWFLN